MFTAAEAVERRRPRRGRDPGAPVHRGRRRRRVRTPPGGSSPPRAARPRTPRSWPAAWAGRASAAPPRSRSTSTRAWSHGNGRELRGGRRSRSTARPGRSPLDDVPLIEPRRSARTSATVLDWADELRRLGVRANADTPEDAARARSFGAEGIGLCRTEHMFFGADRDRLVREMFVAAEELAARRVSGATGRPSARARRAAGASRDARAAGELQRADFEGIFRAMRGLPVTIRLLDPPLHEFLPLGALRGGAGCDRAEGRRPATRSSVASTAWRSSASCTRRTRCWGRGGCGWRSSTRRSTRCRSGRSSRRLRRRRDEGEAARRRDHDAADRLRDRARAAPRAGGQGRPRSTMRELGADLTYHGRHDDRAAEGLPGRRADRAPRRLLQLRHQRPDPDGDRPLARRRRGPLPRPPTSTAASSTAARSRRSTSQESGSWSGSASSAAGRPTRS